jgi:PIN domain nuclease of toxin-antitoxin system
VKLLVDSHTLIWAVDDVAKLGARAVVELRSASNEVLVSAATIWELSIKVGLGKLQLSLPLQEWMETAINDLAATILPITIEHAVAQSLLPFHHRDPFDRLLIAQAGIDGLTLISSDAVLDLYGVARIW